MLLLVLGFLGVVAKKDCGKIYEEEIKIGAAGVKFNLTGVQKGCGFNYELDQSTFSFGKKYVECSDIKDSDYEGYELEPAMIKPALKENLGFEGSIAQLICEYDVKEFSFAANPTTRPFYVGPIYNYGGISISTPSHTCEWKNGKCKAGSCLTYLVSLGKMADGAVERCEKLYKEDPDSWKNSFGDIVVTDIHKFCTDSRTRANGYGQENMESRYERKVCHKLYSCMYHKSKGRCASFSIWAFVLTLVIGILAAVALVGGLFFFLLCTTKGKDLLGSGAKA